MEPLAALSLASSVMQLISFSREVIDVARQVHKAGSVDHDLTDRATALADLAASVRRSLPPVQPTGASLPQKELLEAAQKCGDSATDLCTEVAKVNASWGKGSATRSVITSLKTIWKRRNLEKAEKTMLHWQRVMDSGLLHRICSTTEAQALRNQGDFDKLDETLRRMIEEVARGHAKIVQAAAAESAAIQSHVTVEISKSQGLLSKELNGLRLDAAAEAQREKLLKSLKFDLMNERENLIADSHSETFKWIYLPPSDSRPWNDFAEWLGSDQKLYWISGKPGSGKSTLMKFLVHGEQTRQLLKPDTIILAYYLWSPGHSMQRSVRGLLSTLCHQVLSEKGNLTQSLLARQSRFHTKDHPSDWSYQDMKLCLFECLLSCTRPKCLFLDGLDEISSRPEPVFQRHYELLPKLRLQDLTGSDIHIFCKESLQSFKGLPEDLTLSYLEGTRATNILELLVRNSEGVFLWVHLALKSIQRGCSNSDSSDMILERIEMLPTGLDELYRAMWNRTNVDDGLYEKTGAQYLNYILEACFLGYQYSLYKHTAISVFELMVACEPSAHNCLLDTSAGPTPEELQRYCFTLMKNIESHCAGLVELNAMDNIEVSSKDDALGRLTRFTDITINFIHRTAVDFLTDTKEGKQILALDTSSHDE
ncbi:hypothetical protein GQ53DRAFT_602847, partial [Thozetella sp. PMI_491]